MCILPPAPPDFVPTVDILPEDDAVNYLLDDCYLEVRGNHFALFSYEGQQLEARTFGSFQQAISHANGIVARKVIEFARAMLAGSSK